MKYQPRATARSRSAGRQPAASAPSPSAKRRLPLTPSRESRCSATAPPAKLHQGLDRVVNRIAGAARRHRIALSHSLRSQAESVHRRAEDWRDVKSTVLEARLQEFGAGIRRRGMKEVDPELLQTGLAVLCEAIYRKTHLRPFVEQIMGVLALEQGLLAEMATGEGKTLTIGLAAALAGWRGLPCHVLTANDYLVQRDAEWLQSFYQTCGLRAGYIQGGMDPGERQVNYEADITYATSKEVVADFLRDRLQLGELVHPSRRLLRAILQPGRRASAQCVMRGLFTAIIDEADHVLIDEAVTPLIISRQTANAPLVEAVRAAEEMVHGFEAGRDYLVDATYKDIELRPRAKTALANSQAFGDAMWAAGARREELVIQALKAREFFRRGQQYVIQDDKIVIVDEFTGRVMKERTWKQGLHQAIEAKEGMDPTPPTETISRLSFQRYFRLYPKLSGLTGTAREAAGELWEIYRLPVVSIPTHRPCIRREEPARVFVSEEEKLRAVVEEIVRIHRMGAPVLVGTRSVETSEILAEMLREKALSFQLLNATHHREEAGIVGLAGGPARITIATNMAGRGTDIKLGDGVLEKGGLYVIGTERHESGRVDRQLFGRSARQGEPGHAMMFCSIDDALASRFVAAPLQKLARSLLRSRLPGSRPIVLALLQSGQWRAERFAHRQRQNVLRQDQWLEEALSFSGPGVGE